MILLLIFFSSRSHIFVNRTNIVLASWDEKQMAFQRKKESLRQLMDGSSVSCLSKQEMGARNIMVFTSWK
jgi:hypothetical protein